MQKKCVYDYQNSCTCAEDDKCGCDYDNNMAGDFSCNFDERYMVSKVPAQNTQNKPTNLNSLK